MSADTEQNGGWAPVSAAALALPQRARGLVAAVTDLGEAMAQRLVPLSLPGAERVGLRTLYQVPSECIVMVETDARFEESLGAVVPAAVFKEGMGPNDRVLDGRSGPARAMWRAGGVRVRVRLEDAMVSVESEGGGLEGWEPPAPPRLLEADVEPVLARWKAEPWLERQVRAYAAGTTLQRATALALFARYAAVPPEQALEDDTPWTRALGVWESTPRPLRALVYEYARVAAESLEEQLTELEHLLAARHPAGASRLLLWLHQRDDLESLLLLGQKASESGEEWVGLIDALACLDRQAELVSAALAGVKGVGDERLSALSWRDPGAWWGQLE